jgi:protein translocase SEC61 complex gamma subunit
MDSFWYTGNPFRLTPVDVNPCFSTRALAMFLDAGSFMEETMTMVGEPWGIISILGRTWATAGSGNPYKEANTSARNSQPLGVRDMLKAMGSVFRLSKKSDAQEFTLYLKLVTLGFVAVGAVGFIIKFVSAAFSNVFG